jgi:hypothetical protein
MNDLEDMQKQMQAMGDAPTTPERLDHISMFLQDIESSRPIKNIVDKVKSIGYIDENHMAGHIQMDKAIMKLLKHGQVNLGYELIYGVKSEFRMTMSIKGAFIENVTKQELKYTHTQHLYPHEPDRQPKKGFFRRK